MKFYKLIPYLVWVCVAALYACNPALGVGALAFIALRLYEEDSK